MSNDPFADVLRLTEARSIVSGGIAAGGTWSLHFPPLGEIVFSAILKGGCWLRLDGRRDAVRLEEGDVGLLPGRDGFVLCSDLRAKSTEVVPTDRWNEITTIGDGSGCTWLAGRVALHPSSGMLLTQALPALVHLRAGATDATALRWIVEEIIAEQTSTRPGSSIASAQLAQLFFIKILRSHLTSPDAMPSGWLRAMGDERIAPALRLIHDAPARALGLDELARAAACRARGSRFASRPSRASRRSRTLPRGACASPSARCGRTTRRSSPSPSPSAMHRRARSAMRSSASSGPRRATTARQRGDRPSTGRVAGRARTPSVRSRMGASAPARYS